MPKVVNAENYIMRIFINFAFHLAVHCWGYLVRGRMEAYIVFMEIMHKNLDSKQVETDSLGHLDHNRRIILERIFDAFGYEYVN
jgi:hypothetical protein